MKLSDMEIKALSEDGIGGIKANLYFLMEAAGDGVVVDGATMSWTKDDPEDCDGEDRDWWTLRVDHPSFSIKGDRTELMDAYNVYGDEMAAVAWLRRNFREDWEYVISE
ncbi:hypothetical protein [Sphingomonas sanguinis]|uniref:hypothetical protein n=2 Tax=Sphingomonas sanguinis TaxID=33051 RepID=UPI00301A0F14